jgi:hypothetical protein
VSESERRKTARENEATFEPHNRECFRAAGACVEKGFLVDFSAEKLKKEATFVREVTVETPSDAASAFDRNAHRSSWLIRALLLSGLKRD